MAVQPNIEYRGMPEKEPRKGKIKPRSVSPLGAGGGIISGVASSPSSGQR